MPKADPEQMTFASILNGDFELGSMRYWNAPSGAKWETNARLDSSAQVDTEAHSGTHSLRIIAKADHPTTRTATSQTDSADDAFGRTGQTFSVVAGQPYQLACWVKAKDLSRAAMRVLGPRGQTLIEFDSGSYPWRRITAPLLVDEDPRGSPIAAGSIVPCQIQILATGTGTLWLDDISCQSVAAVPR